MGRRFLRLLVDITISRRCFNIDVPTKCRVTISVFLLVKGQKIWLFRCKWAISLREKEEIVKEVREYYKKKGKEDILDKQVFRGLAVKITFPMASDETLRFK